MRFFSVSSAIFRRGMALCFSAAFALCLLPAPSAFAVSAQPDVLLGAFWSSDSDTTDTLYLSVDGIHFQSLGAAYQDATPNDSSTSWIPNTRYNVSTLHDPSILYKNSWFWMLSGYTQDQNGQRRFTPMLGCSKDLVHWSYPNSGSATNVGVTETPPGKNGTSWDSVAPDFMVDDDGTVWIVVSLGYYANFHGDASQNDVMKPYLIKASGLTPGADPASDPGAQPAVSYSDAMPINLPKASSNRIDGSLYKENGWYYFTVKENGVTNEIWRTQDLSRCSDSSSWQLVCANATTGYEGPSLTKYNGKYLLYTDKLRDWPPETADGTSGEYVCAADSLGPIWGGSHKIVTQDKNGSTIANHHGTVIAVTDPAAKRVIWNLYYSLGYSTPAAQAYPADNGWVQKDILEFYWYENGVRQGLEGRGKEIYDPGSGAWYWLDSIQNGAKAYNKDVYQDSSGGKWVRYNYQGQMIKGEQHYHADDGNWYWYFFDLTTGAMAKGLTHLPDGRWVYYDENTGRMLYGEQHAASGWYLLDPYTGEGCNGWHSKDGKDYWYENGKRQGTEGRGKEIYDPASGGWYWLDAVQDGAKAVSKDVYQESSGGKWVRYDANGSMIKGWQTTAAGTYYFDPVTGAMAKGTVTINGVRCHFDESTGIQTQ